MANKRQAAEAANGNGNGTRNRTILPFWTTKRDGMFISKVMDQEALEALFASEKGGKLVFKLVASKSRRSDNSPYAYLEYVSKADVDSFRAKMATSSETASVADAADTL